MNKPQIKNFLTNIKKKMKPNKKYCLLPSDDFFSFSINNMEKCYVVPYHDQDIYDKDKMILQNPKLGEHLVQLMKISGNHHLVDEIISVL